MILALKNVHFHYSHRSPHFGPSFLPSNLHVQSSSGRPPQGVRMDSSSSSATEVRDKRDKVVVIMGATGCGKSGLSIDLAVRLGSEIINSDKMQVYRGLDITTNKIAVPDRRGVRHHILGDVDPEKGEFTRSQFRLSGALAISNIVSQQKLPMVVGGSNSFIHALLVDRFDQDVDACDIGSGIPSPISTQLRYNCCFIWVDVASPILCDYLCKRVDEMLEAGMFEELSEFYLSPGQPGLRKAIGVPEFDPYFKNYPPGCGGEWDQVRKGAFEEAVRKIKENTRQLAKRQIGKIMRLKGAGWDLQRVEATEAFKEAMKLAGPSEPEGIVMQYKTGKINIKNNNANNNNNYYCNKRKKEKDKRWIEVWEREVVEPSVKIVKQFLAE